MRDLEIHRTIMAVVDEYTGLPGQCQPRYAHYPYPQRLPYLSWNLKVHVLREQGDIKQYLALQKEIDALAPEQTHKEDKQLHAIISWLDGKMARAPCSRHENAIVISYLAFGEAYLDKLLAYNFPSLLSPGNLPTLVKAKTVVFYIQTDANGHARIEAAEATLALKALGVVFEYTIIPEDIASLLDNKHIIYWMLGACASLSIHYAKAIGAVFHHSYPDIVYSERFFSELLRLSASHKAILGCGMRGDQTLIIPAFKPYLRDGHLAVPSADLMAIHMNGLHMCAFPTIVNNRPDFWFYPLNHVMMYESEELIHINSPHQMAFWLDHSVIKDLPPRFYMTLDSEMDLVCKGQDYYIVQENDHAYQVELSLPERQGMDDVFGGVEAAAAKLWESVCHRNTAKFFFRGMRVRVNRNIRSLPANYIPLPQVISTQNFLFNFMVARDPYGKQTLARGRTHAGYMFL